MAATDKRAGDGVTITAKVKYKGPAITVQFKAYAVSQADVLATKYECASSVSYTFAEAANYPADADATAVTLTGTWPALTWNGAADVYIGVFYTVGGAQVGTTYAGYINVYNQLVTIPAPAFSIATPTFS